MFKNYTHKMEFKFKKELSLDKRKEQSQILLIKDPTRIPVILEKDPNCKLQEIKKTKFLIKKDFTLNHFSRMITAIYPISDVEALFFTAKGKYALSGDKTMGQIYNEFKDKEDGFLYIAYTTEVVFG